MNCFFLSSRLLSFMLLLFLNLVAYSQSNLLKIQELYAKGKSLVKEGKHDAALDNFNGSIVNLGIECNL